MRTFLAGFWLVKARNRCSSACHGPDRSHLIVPGFRSSRIHIVNVADDPRAPWIEKVIEADELVSKTGYTRPHTRSVDALQAFAGPDWQKAVIEPEEEHMLAQVFCDHYDEIETG